MSKEDVWVSFDTINANGQALIPLSDLAKDEVFEQIEAYREMEKKRNKIKPGDWVARYDNGSLMLIGMVGGIGHDGECQSEEGVLLGYPPDVNPTHTRRAYKLTPKQVEALKCITMRRQ